MSGFFKHLRDARNANVVENMMKSRMSNYEKLKKRIESLYESVQITSAQKSEIDRLRLEYSTKSRQLLEDFMAKEIKVLEDLENKFQYSVGTYEDIAKQKLSLNKN